MEYIAPQKFLQPRTRNIPSVLVCYAYIAGFPDARNLIDEDDRMNKKSVRYRRWKLYIGIFAVLYMLSVCVFGVETDQNAARIIYI